MMRTTVLSSILAALVLAVSSGPASAEVRQVGLSVALLELPEECAVQVEVEEVVDDLFNGSEALLFGDTMVGSFAPLTETRSNISVGTSVLFGSPAFRNATGADVDVEIADSDCARLVPGFTIGFRGSFGADAGSLTLPDDFGPWSYVGADGGLTDLEVASIFLVNAAGDSYQVGDGPADTGGGGGGSGSSSGCSAGPARALPAPLLALFAGLAVAIVARRRRVE